MKVILGAAVLVIVAFVGLAWWLVDRPFGGATCWVNYTAKTYDEAVLLNSNLRRDGLDANVSGLKAGRPPALPVVSIDAGFWQTEESLEEQVLAGLRGVGEGKFDQCRTPSLGD